MKGTVVFDGSASAAFNIRSGVKQGCVLAPTFFGISFAVMLKHAFGPATDGIYLRTGTDGNLSNLSRLRAKTKVQLRCLRDFLFADDAAVTAHSAEDLQQLMTRFRDACQDFRLSITLKKTQVMGQDVDSPKAISINGHELERERGGGGGRERERERDEEQRREREEKERRERQTGGRTKREGGRERERSDGKDLRWETAQCEHQTNIGTVSRAALMRRGGVSIESNFPSATLPF